MAGPQDPIALDKFKEDVEKIILSLENEFFSRFEKKDEANLMEAEKVVMKMQFMHKLRQEAGRIEERFLDL